MKTKNFLYVGLTTLLTMCGGQQDTGSRPEKMPSQPLIGSDTGTSTKEPIPAKSTPCPEDMILVEGNYCPKLVETCIKYMEPKKYDICLEFKKPSVCKSQPEEMLPLKFCVDRDEYRLSPQDNLPAIMMSFNRMSEACKAQGKRLCTDIEWTKACQGPENKPYPYGYVRDSKICYHDQVGEAMNYNLGEIEKGNLVAIRKADHRRPASDFPLCVSDYGVHNMPGSLDEWVIGPGGDSQSKGGHYVGHVRNRCIPATSGHGPDYTNHLFGGRCCANPR